MDKIRLGIIGIGNMGSGHMRSAVSGQLPDFELTAICDMNKIKLDWAAKNISDKPKQFTDAIEMLDSGLIDACIVAVPHYFHCKYAIECMKRGIHVMVEKPAGVYTKQVREMNACADEHPDVVFGMMFNQRTDHIYRKMREIVQSGKYGEIRRTNWIITNWYRPQAYYDSGDWRATWSGEGGGVLLNQSPHQLDLWQWICGMPVTVESHMKFGKWHDIEVEDDVSTYVEYENGATGVFITSTGDARGSNRFEIQLDGAALIAENGRLRFFEYDVFESEFTKTNKGVWASVPGHDVEVETDGLSLQHNGVLNAWGGRILRGTPLVADGREGINGLTLSNAMHLSAFLGKEVKIPFDEDLFLAELTKRIETSKRKDTGNTVISDIRTSYHGTIWTK